MENPPIASTLPDTLSTAKSITVLMVDDQPVFGEAIRRMLANEADIAFHFINKPEQALLELETLKPTVILQDLVMPQVDGLTMVKKYRTHPITREVPIIVLSSREESDIKSMAFAAGANDYMVKLPEKLEVIARIRYHSHAYIHLIERNEAYEALVQSQALLKAELSEAAKYVRSILPQKVSTPEMAIDWLYIPSSELGGDTFGYHWIAPGQLAIYLIDVCGHGVGAALLSVSAINLLRGFGSSDINFASPAAVCSKLNDVFDMSKQNDMYFTLWYGVYSIEDRTLVYTSAGHPPAILKYTDGSTQLLSTENTMIGAFANNTFTEAHTTIPIGAHLYIFSDGVYEICLPNTQQMILFDVFLSEISKPEQQSHQKLQEILRYTQAIQGKPNFEDDFSLIEIRFML